MSADDVKSLMEDAEIDGPLVDWRPKEALWEYLGTEDVDGNARSQTESVRKNGDVSFVYLDPGHFLEIRILTQRTSTAHKKKSRSIRRLRKDRRRLFDLH